METLVLASFAFLCFFAVLFKRYTQSDVDVALKSEKTETNEAKFKRLQWKFFSAYFLALLGDWLQGPYVYQVPIVQ